MSDREYGSQEVPGVAEFPLMLLVVLTSTLEFGRCGCHDSVAAFAAAGGGLLRSVVAILLLGSFGFDRRVLNIPPTFFSGLGVRPRCGLLSGAFKFGDIWSCRLFERGMSLIELFWLVNDGLGGRPGL